MSQGADSPPFARGGDRLTTGKLPAANHNAVIQVRTWITSTEERGLISHGSTPDLTRRVPGDARSGTQGPVLVPGAARGRTCLLWHRSCAAATARTRGAHTQGVRHQGANCSATNHPSTRSVSTCSGRDQRNRGRGQIRTRSPTQAVGLGPQLEFQAAQGTEWVFRVSFQLNSMIYCHSQTPGT